LRIQSISGPLIRLGAALMLAGIFVLIDRALA